MPFGGAVASADHVDGDHGGTRVDLVEDGQIEQVASQSFTIAYFIGYSKSSCSYIILSSW